METALYQAVRAGFATVEAGADEERALPRRVRAEVERYLGCGDVRRGFVQVRCTECRRSELVAFSCKQRGLCPSCGARRSHEVAAHCGKLLPEVAYRQWTLSAPYAVRWALVKHPWLMARMERLLVDAVGMLQRKVARRLDYTGKLCGGAVGFRQYFGSALQLTPHLHVLMPEGLWTAAGEPVPLPPPAVEDVEWVLRRVVKRLAKEFARVGEAWPEDGLDLLRAEALQQRLPLVGEAPRRLGRRVAMVEGFNLHADTWVHANDRAGLERLCRYGSRGPVALERLSKREDGLYEYRTRKGQVLVFTAAALVRRLVALLPPERVHLTRYHGVFAPNAKLRGKVVRPRRVEPQPPQQQGWGCAREGSPSRRPRLDWATLQQRTFEADVWQCPCGGRRRVVAVVSNRRTAEEVLRNLGRLPPRPVPHTGQSPPQLALAL